MIYDKYISHVSPLCRLAIAAAADQLNQEIADAEKCSLCYRSSYCKRQKSTGCENFKEKKQVEVEL